MGRDRGRGWLSSFDRLPAEADEIVRWAALELAGRERTQTEIYAEFVARCEELMAAQPGEVAFEIPGFKSFNRFSLRQARISRRLDDTREIVAVLAAKHDPKASDELTILAAETIKAAVLYAVSDSEDQASPRDVKAMADALRAAQAAQNMSSDRRAREDARLAERLGEAVETAARSRGLSAATAEAIKAEILGVALPQAPEVAP